MANSAHGKTRPFEVSWSAADIERLRADVRSYSYPPEAVGAGWRFGCDPTFLKAFCRYWLDEYDITAALGELNAYPQFTAEVEPGVVIHFVHVPGEGQVSRPLLMIHGWPGSHYQFWPTVEALAFPSRHGGRREDAFDLIIPSLPGYGYSSKPHFPVGARATAAWFAKLMRDHLGYAEYLVSGTDWGVVVAPWMALDHGESVRGIHIDNLALEPEADAEEAERIRQRRFDEHRQLLGAYYHLHTTKPQSLAYAMTSNPVAQAAWILERFHDWADLGGRTVDEVFGMHRLVTNMMLYVMTGSFSTATWFYTGTELEGSKRMPNGRRVTAPTGFSAFPDPCTPNPSRDWLERGYNVVYWSEHRRGGHFPTMEAPELVIDDLRAWARIIPAR